MNKKLLMVFCMLLALMPVFAGGGAEEEKAAEVEAVEEGPYRFTATRSWDLAQGRIDFEDQPEKSLYFKYIEDTVGIVPQCYCFDWEGGVGYQNSVRLFMASGTIPEAILEPFSTDYVLEMYNNGLLIPLDDYLDKAPLIMAQYSDAELDIIRSLTPDGKIYYLPNKSDEPRQGMIRKDWLDAVGMDVPTTKDELIAVYRAFKEQDANGNGDPDDEIPVSSREGLRWCDDLFVMHGVAMVEGHPEWSWDAKTNTMISHQVSDNMKDALDFIRFLIDEGLMQREAPINPSSDWFATIAADKIGHYFHLAASIERRLAMVTSGENPDAEWVYLPNVSVPGLPHQKNYYLGTRVPQICITIEAKDPGKILEWFNWNMTEEGKKYTFYGIEGVNYKVEGGKIISDADNPPDRNDFALRQANYDAEAYRQTNFGEMKATIYEASINDGRGLDNNGMPESVYEGYDDFRANSMTGPYRQFAAKYVLGELDEADWDQYVKDWYANGGQVVTDRATEWYKSVH